MGAQSQLTTLVKPAKYKRFVSMTMVVDTNVLSQCIGTIRFVACANYAEAVTANTIGNIQKLNEHKCFPISSLKSSHVFKYDIETGEKMNWTDWQSLPVIAIVLDIQGRQPTISDASQIHFTNYTLAYYK